MPRPLVEFSSLIEPCPIARTFCTELARIEKIGPCSMLVFAMEQASSFGGEKERTIEARVILPTDALPALAAMIAKAAGSRDDVQRSALAAFASHDGRAN